MKVEDIIDDCREFKLSVKSKWSDVELSTVSIDGLIMHSDITLIKSSVEEFLLYREELYSVSVQYSESC